MPINSCRFICSPVHLSNQQVITFIVFLSYVAEMHCHPLFRFGLGYFFSKHTPDNQGYSLNKASLTQRAARPFMQADIIKWRLIVTVKEVRPAIDPTAATMEIVEPECFSHNDGSTTSVNPGLVL